jgi:meiotically up-regulated gene 157 (Mug157) protein
MTKRWIYITVGSVMPNLVAEPLPADLLDELVRSVAERTRSERIGQAFRRSFGNTIETTIQSDEQGRPFVITGDIPAMWLRDSSAQLAPYLGIARDHGPMADLIAGVIGTQFRLILVDSYANAFNRTSTGGGHPGDLCDDPWIWEQKYEIDSFAFPLWLAYRFWKTTGRTDIVAGDFPAAARVIIDQLRLEQDHEARSSYRFVRDIGVESETLARDGLGAPVGYTELANQLLDDPELARDALALANELADGVRRHGIVRHPDHGDVYAYEVDGLGNTLLMDDANMPSLLSLPWLGCVAADDPVYRATRALVLSPTNPFFYEGSAAAGVGSPHTPDRYVWPIALSVQGLTSDDADEQRRLIELLIDTDGGTGLMHEGFDVDDPSRFTRPWFSWANAMFCQLILEHTGLDRSLG